MKGSKKAARNIASRMFAIAVFCILAFVSYKFYIQLDQALFVKSRHRSELDELEKQYQQIRKERQRYEEAIEKLKKDEYIELVARKQFRMIKPGEKAYIVVFENETSTSETGQSLLDLLCNQE